MSDFFCDSLNNPWPINWCFTTLIFFLFEEITKVDAGLPYNKVFKNKPHTEKVCSHKSLHKQKANLFREMHNLTKKHALMMQ